ncbi:unnamed protein product [Lampetra planeri]
MAVVAACFDFGQSARPPNALKIGVTETRDPQEADAECWAYDEEGDEDEEDREEEEQGCLWNQFQCGGGACVPRSWVCDWESDCSDGSDETSCQYSGQDDWDPFEETSEAARAQAEAELQKALERTLLREIGRLAPNLGDTILSFLLLRQCTSSWEFRKGVPASEETMGPSDTPLNKL